MTIEQALQYINESVEESKKRLEDTIRALHLAIENGNPRYVKLDIKSFESLLFEVIRYKWLKQYPEAFLGCHVTGDEYNTVPKNPYRHYMKIINGDLKNFIYFNELDDVHIHRHGYTDENKLDMFKKRLEVIENLFLDDDVDIIKWCVFNVWL
jgi:hypothetical protein